MFLRWLSRLLWVGLALGIGACTTRPAKSPMSATATVPATPEIRVVTPTPTPAPPPVLVLCYGQEPESLYLYSGKLNLTAWNMLQLLYDGPIDYRDFRDVPMILERLPSLDNGDAEIRQVTVKLGDPIVDVWGRVVRWQAGVTYRPAGCLNEDCARTVGPEDETAVMDQMVVRFRLRRDIRWADGQPVTAQDSVFSFELAKAGIPLNPWLLERTASYRAVNDVTVEWTGLPGFLNNTYHRNFWWPLPAHRFAGKTPKEVTGLQEVHRNPLGWGPYRLTAWQDHTMTFEPNPYYFRQKEGLPRFSKVIVRFFDNPEEALAALMVGECDVVSETVGLEHQSKLLFALAKSEKVKVSLAPGPAFEHLGFVLYNQTLDDGLNYRDPSSPFSDRRVREAAARCINKERLIQEVFGGFVEPYATFLPPEHPDYAGDAIPTYPYDPKTAQALLEEAGWVDHDKDPTTPHVFRGRSLWVRPGEPLRVTLATSTAPLRLKAAQHIQDDLRQCGFQVDIQTWRPEELFAPGPEGPVFGRRVDMALFGWSLAPETMCHLWLTEAIPGSPEAAIGDVLWLRQIWPQEARDRDAFLYDWNGWNYHAWSDPAFDKACRTVLFNPPERKGYAEAWTFVQVRLAEELPLLSLYSRMTMVVTRADFCGYTPDPGSPFELRDVEAFGYGEMCQ